MVKFCIVSRSASVLRSRTPDTHRVVQFRPPAGTLGAVGFRTRRRPGPRGDDGGAVVIHIRREFTSDPEQLAELRAVVAAACRQAWADAATDDIVQRVQLAVQEAATNILRHAYRGDPAGPIRVDLT